MKKIAILGSTGSIGTQTLEVVAEHKDIEVVALACGRNIQMLESQMRQFQPKLVAVWNETDAVTLRNSTRDLSIPVYTGMEGLLAVATIPEAEILVTAIVGMLGIRPTIAAIAGLISMVGDLTASAIKRFFDIKDYGHLIPGHGGIMDRFDSMIITAPIIYFLAYHFI